MSVKKYTELKVQITVHHVLLLDIHDGIVSARHKQGNKLLRELCHGCLVNFVNTANYASLFAMDLRNYL